LLHKSPIRTSTIRLTKWRRILSSVLLLHAVELAPTVDATTPTNGAVNQATNTNVSVTFSEPVNVTGNWFQIVCGTSGTRNVADTVVTGGPTTFTINPNVDFAAGETCTVTIFAAQVTDQDSNDPPDNMAANFVFSFSMDTAPSVTATTPTNGATQQANNTNVTITFSEPVDVTGNWFQLVGATSGTRNVADTVVTGGPTTFTINPNVDFANGELVTVTVFAAQVTDQDGGDPPDNMAANFVFSFTIDQAPSVTSTTPTNGATNQALASNVSITFSEPVNVAGNWFQIVCANSGTRNVADTVVTGGPTTFTINPNADFTPNETCTVTVFAAQVTDQDSGDPPDNMTANFVFSFTTIDLAPTVTATTPTNGALNQATNTDISVTFSEPVNVTGNWFQIVCATSGTTKRGRYGGDGRTDHFQHQSERRFCFR
jgi:methionine-rich copper-binding protein CopC